MIGVRGDIESMLMTFRRAFRSLSCVKGHRPNYNVGYCTCFCSSLFTYICYTCLFLGPFIFASTILVSFMFLFLF